LRRFRTLNIKGAIWEVYGFNYAMIGIWKLIWGASIWTGVSFVLKEIMKYVQKKESIENGFQWAIYVLITSLVCTVSIQQLVSQSFLTGVRIKSALSYMIFKKSLRLERLNGGSGDVVNLMSNDCQKVAEACINFHYLWSAAIEIIGKKRRMFRS
jgi:hypothetical protein